ncbi:alpha/beta hydrolase [Kaistella sp. BT6-1-3]|uniref:Alpha/beta hydrolase n=1 Tax=Kaistella yananensis TaxID=2989820 RepID=A0ABT3JIS9_9FLAO|nr:alpha/beta fold hydrolase [Kaistella yananensis]MCW4450688.1 alpha/beta hydrolase [Kaistella yananensis]
MKELVLQTPDQFPISVKIFEPEIPKRKLLVINSATGVRQQVYFSFAKYLATQGFTVITYDYRGIGESKPRKMKGFEASMRIWGTRDFKTITGFIKENYPDYTKFCLGHSVGALILGMNEDSVIFKKFIFVSTQDAYIGHLSWRVAVTAALGFGIAVPVTVILKGYFPAHRFGLGESLPKGSAYDWRTLILNKKSTGRLYEKIEKDYSKDLNQEAFIIHAEDDSWVTMKGMESLMNNSYPNMKKTYREIKVSESPKKQVGHINFFRSYNLILWKIILDKIQ